VLPSLLQNYPNHLAGDLLVVTLHICFILYGSKQPVVSKAAEATLQQLVVAVFGKVAQEDGARVAQPPPPFLPKGPIFLSKNKKN
jgi:hypothetical protein